MAAINVTMSPKNLFFEKIAPGAHENTQSKSNGVWAVVFCPQTSFFWRKGDLAHYPGPDPSIIIIYV
jgi:hypothetical protein